MAFSTLADSTYFMLHFFSTCTRKSTPWKKLQTSKRHRYFYEIINGRGVSKIGPNKQAVNQMWKGGVDFGTVVLHVPPRTVVFAWLSLQHFQKLVLLYPIKRKKFVTRLSLIFLQPLLGVDWKCRLIRSWWINVCSNKRYKIAFQKYIPQTCFAWESDISQYTMGFVNYR